MNSLTEEFWKTLMTAFILLTVTERYFSGINLLNGYQVFLLRRWWVLPVPIIFWFMWTMKVICFAKGDALWQRVFFQGILGPVNCICIIKTGIEYPSGFGPMFYGMKKRG